jgi:hypothetical protein
MGILWRCGQEHLCRLIADQIWNISNSEVVQKFDTHSGAVSCMRYNPRELSMATAGADRHTIIWDLENFKVQSESKTESTAVEALAFDTEGKFLFTACQDSLKVWRADMDCKPVNSFAMKWKGVKDMKISPDNQSVLGVATGPKGFALWKTEWTKMPASPMTGGEFEDERARAGYIDKAPPRHALSKDNIPNAEDIKVPNNNLGSSKDPRYNMLETLAEIRKDHKKFSTSLEEKKNYLNPILHWLNTSNTRAALNAIDKQNDPMVIIDLINMIINTKKLDSINIEFATTLVRKATMLAESQFIIHIKTGLMFVSMCIARFKNVVSLLHRKFLLSRVQI